ncbi:E7 protein [Bos taurus papillomavirus 6]|uniref:Protein E7 n=1 Tax=Bos taurus papillomavirus 6 TaxID=10563 RepID=W6JN36_BPV6|nr:E7 protein [Bos taurus papillomavirus 6]
MKGQSMILKDLATELEEVVSPINLDCEEEIETEEVDCPAPFAVEAVCHVCEQVLRLAVVASPDGILQLQQLLLTDSLSFLCTSCSREAFCNRRPQRNGS